MNRGITAWLITWEWGSPSAEVVDRVVAIISGRKSERTVAELLEFLYANATSTCSELAAYARNAAHNPYPARTGELINDVPHGDRILCGAHPWLYGRKVTNLRVERDEQTGLETISWVEPKQLKWNSDRTGVEEAAPPKPDRATREISGATQLRAGLGPRHKYAKAGVPVSGRRDP